MVMQMSSFSSSGVLMASKSISFLIGRRIDGGKRRICQIAVKMGEQFGLPIEDKRRGEMAKDGGLLVCTKMKIRK
jgi:hypothetical protein